MNKIKVFFLTFSKPDLLIVAIILCIGVIIRFDDLGKQFTTGDDVGVAWTLTQAKSGYTLDFVKNKIYNQSHTDYNTPQYKILRGLEKKGILEKFLPSLNLLAKIVVIPQAWTYAPVQFLFSPLLLLLVDDYPSLMFWGRFPSFFFSVMALVAMVFLYFRLKKENFLIPCLVGLLLLTFSWENIIYAKHMSSYAIGVLAAVLLLHTLVTVLKSEKLTIKKGIFIGFVLVFLTNMQYQIFYFIPVVYFVWFLKILSERQTVLNSIKEFFKSQSFKVIICSALSFAVFILPTFILYIAPQSEAGGQNNPNISEDFYFNISTSSTVVEKVVYTTNFFFINSLKSFQFITTFLPYNSLLVNFCFIGILTFFILGIISFIYNNKEYRFIGKFFIFSFFTVFCLVLLKKMPLSPTRHLLILLPFLVFIISEGVEFVFSSVVKNKIVYFKYVIALILIVSVTLPFFFNYKSVVENRREQFDTNFVSELIKTYNPRYVILPAYCLWKEDVLKNWKRIDPDITPYSTDANIFENNNIYDANVMIMVQQSDFPTKMCDENSVNNKILNSVCNPELSNILYEYIPKKGGSLDISAETKVFYNTFLVKVIKIK